MKETYLRAHAGMIHPIPDQRLWEPVEGDVLEPPPLRRLPGRPRKNRRREVDDAAAGTSESRRSQTIKCSNCQHFGHNKRSCQRAPVAKKKPPQRPANNGITYQGHGTSTQVSDCVTQVEGSGPSRGRGSTCRERGRAPRRTRGRGNTLGRGRVTRPCTVSIANNGQESHGSQSLTQVDSIRGRGRGISRGRGKGKGLGSVAPTNVYAFGVVMLEVLCGRPAVDTQVEEDQHSLVRWAQQSIKENKLDQLIDPRLRDQISPHCLKVFAEVANNCLDSHPKGRPTMADVVVRLECALASENNHFGSLAQGNAPSSSTLALYNENTQGQHRSKGNVSKAFQRTIEFLAKGADINWKKRKTYLQSTAIRRRDPEEWMRYRRLTEDLQQGVRHFVHNRWLATRRVADKTILRGLPADIRRDIQHHLRLDLVRRVPFLLEMDDQLLDALCERLVSSLSTKGTYILREGYPVTKMLFIIKGSLESFAKNIAGTRLFDSIMLGPGDFCGEELLAWAFLPKSTITLPSSGRTIRALVKVKAFALKAEDLRFVATQFRRLYREKMQHTFRFYSKNWRTWATCIIQVAWRWYKRRRLTNGLTAVESFAESQTRQEAEQDGSPKNSSRFQAKLKLGVIVPKFSDQLVPALQKPEEPDFCAESETDD